jgi:hypothetical protein
MKYNLGDNFNAADSDVSNTYLSSTFYYFAISLLTT